MFTFTTSFVYFIIIITDSGNILFFNGKIYTSPQTGVETWMIINTKSGNILEVGSGEKEWSGEKVDLLGKLVLPVCLNYFFIF